MTLGIINAIKTLIEDNGNLHEVMYVQGDLESHADIDAKLLEPVNADIPQLEIKINGRKFLLTLEEQCNG